jgi:hypothetical protein
MDVRFMRDAGRPARIVAALAALWLAAPAARAGEAAKGLATPCVVELFTSQGCSSCPKADALLQRLAMQDGVIALTMPVDYWDYLGWKDTLAQPVFTRRQKGYAAARGDSHVFTPQVVVSGAAQAIGSDGADIARASGAARAAGAMAVPVRIGEKGAQVEIGAAPPGAAREGQVVALRVARARTVDIGRGENRGRSVTYANVVRGVERLGPWNGAARVFEIPQRLSRMEGDALVVLLQAGDAERPGLVLGAAMTR